MIRTYIYGEVPNEELFIRSRAIATWHRRLRRSWKMCGTAATKRCGNTPAALTA